MKRNYRGKRKPFQTVVFVLLAVLFLTAGGFAASKLLFREPVVAPEPEDEAALGHSEDEIPEFNDRKPHTYNILLCGVDDGNGGSDTMILLHVDGEKNAVFGVSIPRDTLIDVDWKVKKINASYNKGGISLVKEKVSELLGVPVDFTVEVNLKAFIALVDSIGGVDFEVPIDMDYDDPYQNLHIHLKQGMQHLDGESAMGAVRFRHNNDGSGYGTQDIGRIGTQQAFLKTVAKTMLQNIAPDDISSYINIFKQYVDTDLTVNNLLWLAKLVYAAGADGIQFFTLPGDGTGWYNGGSYYILYPDEVLALVNDYFNPYALPRTAEDLHVFAPA